jgi:hypothetical protein
MSWAGTAGASEAPEKVREVKAVSNAVELTVALTEKGVAGEALPITITLRNAGRAVVTYGEVAGIGDYKLAVKDAEGKAIPVTRYGKWWLETVGGGGGERYKYVIRKLEPGQSMSLSANLTRLYDLTVAGKYTLVVSRKINADNADGQAFTVQTEAIPFEIVEPETAEAKAEAPAARTEKEIRGR